MATKIEVGKIEVVQKWFLFMFCYERIYEQPKLSVTCRLVAEVSSFIAGCTTYS